MAKKLKNGLTGERERERERVVVWALFDDAEGSVFKTVKQFFKDKITLYSVGINDIKRDEEHLYYRKIDLSFINFDLYNQLNQLPKPDILLASPPCESWSGADCDGKMLCKIDENYNWKIKNKNFYDEYNTKSHLVKRRYFEQKERGRILGEATAAATHFIIDKYKPKVYVIENPQTSKIWSYLTNHCGRVFNYENLANYNAYDESFSKKPTYFQSNIDLELKCTKEKGNYYHMACGSYKQRSSIPLDLIKDILTKSLQKLKK